MSFQLAGDTGDAPVVSDAPTREIRRDLNDVGVANADELSDLAEARADRLIDLRRGGAGEPC
jgi:hypothetical protein